VIWYFREKQIIIINDGSRNVSDNLSEITVDDRMKELPVCYFIFKSIIF
jgi:hypothetical protein